jgi:tetratricopeptide (TPR) repeat protein
MEDLHWIDASSDECLTALVERMAGAALLILVTYRPGYRPAWIDKSYATQVSLQPLSPQDSLRVVQAVLPAAGQAAPLLPQLLAKAEGNPFFLEELARTVAEQGAAVSSSTVPDTVQAVLTARMDRLPATAKHLLLAAAVIGKDVALPLLQAVTEMSEEDLHGDLRTLQAAEFLYETYALTAPVYTFKHTLTHEVAYGSLLQERRRALHADIVDASERLYADRLPEQAERLAQHAVQGAVWDKAVAYCRQASTKAFARSAFREGVGYAEQALEALTHLPESRATQEQAIDLRFDLRHALFALGEFKQVVEHLREAATLAETLDDQPRLARISAYMCRYLREIGDHDGAVEYGQHALTVAESLRDFTLQVMAQHTLGVACHTLGDHRRAIGLLKSNVESLAGDLLRERCGLSVLPAVISRTWLVRCLAELGAFPEGIVHAAEAVRIAEAVNHPHSLIHAYLGVGFLSLRQRDLSRAIRVLEHGLDLCRVWHIVVSLPTIAAALGCAYAMAGRVVEALPLLEQTEEQDTAMGITGGQALRVGYVGEAYLLAGRMQEAVCCAGRALTLARAHKERGHEAWALRLLGEIATHQAHPESAPAAQHYRQALALAQELGMRPLVAHCHLGLGTLYARTGQRLQARAELFTAIEMYRAMEMMFWLPQAEVALAQVEGE